MTKDSAPVEFLRLMWKQAQKGTGHSWLKLNHGMRHALELAVKSGMVFEENDLGTIFKDFNAGYWWGADTEWFYGLAVLYRNASAYQAYEKRRNRKPFIVKGASWSGHTGDGPVGRGLARLIVGSEFPWNGERVKVSSFNDAKDTFTALSYERREGEKCPSCTHYTLWPKATIRNRYTISHAGLAAAKKMAKKAAKDA